ncbi:MAG: hypothetical protein K5905_04340 [Roseibium sp.]|uniref:hypothetical protein n=1 Tax=Roseibium sp. TaxID=1936156 RepID=UPI0026106FA1|nr:hypothetical protein [Roseibium sp.]MCV0424679.1 hypothetical protein [Roseibium sp.]
MITRYLRLTSPEEVLTFVGAYWPDPDPANPRTIDDCRLLPGEITLPNDDPEEPAETRKALIAMPTYLGVLGGVPDEDAAPIQQSYTDEGGNQVNYQIQPLKLQENGEPYIHVNVGWRGTEAELLTVALAALSAAVSPDAAFLAFAD